MSNLAQLEKNLEANSPSYVKELIRGLKIWEKGVEASTAKLQEKVDSLESSVEELLDETPEEGLSPEVANILKASYDQSRVVFLSIKRLLESAHNPLDQISTKKFMDLVVNADTAVAASIGLVGQLVIDYGDDESAPTPVAEEAGEPAEIENDEDEDGDVEEEVENV